MIQLKKEMKKRGISQTQLAKELGKSKSSVSQYLSGKVIPDGETMDKILTFLEIEPEEKKETSSISVEEAARRLHKPPQFVRLALQQGTAPFGFAVKSKQWSYHISSKKLNEYIGEEDEII